MLLHEEGFVVPLVAMAIIPDLTGDASREIDYPHPGMIARGGPHAI
jgi:hypothetical protein